MLFNGTTNPSAEDIARPLDSVGGNRGAFTARQLVCFNTRCSIGTHARNVKRSARPTIGEYYRAVFAPANLLITAVGHQAPSRLAS